MKGKFVIKQGKEVVAVVDRKWVIYTKDKELRKAIKSVLEQTETLIPEGEGLKIKDITNVVDKYNNLKEKLIMLGLTTEFVSY